MGNVRYALTIFAMLAAIMIMAAYWAGTNKLANTGFTGLDNLAMTFQGRNIKTGNFAPYPGNAPSTGSGG